jgi:hypothetical protein
LNATTGYNRSVASGGSMRLDLVTVTAVPEPTTTALLAGTAILGTALALRRRRAKTQASSSPADHP